MHYYFLSGYVVDHRAKRLSAGSLIDYEASNVNSFIFNFITARFSITILNEYWVDLYVKPYVRCGPYIIGCLTGYMLLEKDRPIFKLNTVQWIIGWIIGITLGAYSIFGLFNYTTTGEINAAYSM
jgi:hypothetical protein